MTAEDDDECPICHTQRYLRRDMRFLLNPECYHKMCENCVDRIFSHGPAGCPVAGCGKTLRRQRFRLPTFEDLSLEREMDIRRTVAQAFNRREGEFESARAWNDYLNEVEDLTHNLIAGIEVEATQRKLARYTESNRDSIAHNSKLAAVEQQQHKALLARQLDASRLSRNQAMDEDEIEKRAKELVRRQVIESLASGGDAFRIAKEGQRALSRRLGPIPPSKRSVGDQARGRDGELLGASDDGFTFSGLRTRLAGGDAGATSLAAETYDPFGGQTTDRDYVMMPDRLDSLWESYLGRTKVDTKIVASGYQLHEFVDRALVECFAGLDVFVGEEMQRKEDKRRKRQQATATDTATAAAAATDSQC